MRIYAVLSPGVTLWHLDREEMEREYVLQRELYSPREPVGLFALDLPESKAEDPNGLAVEFIDAEVLAKHAEVLKGSFE